jgi:hypothetical protein
MSFNDENLFNHGKPSLAKSSVHDSPDFHHHHAPKDYFPSESEDEIINMRQVNELQSIDEEEPVSSVEK